MTQNNPDLHKKKIQEAAYQLFHQNGYTKTGLSDIISKSGLTKGAIYHHFSSKKEIGISVIDETIRYFVEDKFLYKMRETVDPIGQIRENLLTLAQNRKLKDIKKGCPLYNLAIELSANDEDFRIKLNEIFQEWIQIYENAIVRGKEAGNVKLDSDAHAMASYLVASIEGMIGLGKNFQDRKVMIDMFTFFLMNLEFYRP